MPLSTNAKQALLILLNVPFALVGGIAALWLRGLNLNLSASIGFIALFGVAVLNGIVMVSHINSLREQGQKREGRDQRRRVRPFAAGADDGAGGESWVCAHGAVAGAGRGSATATRDRGDRRVDHRNDC